MKHMLLCACITFALQARAQLAVTELFTENQHTPNALSTQHPRFTWILGSDRRDTRQTAYELRVAVGDADFKGNDILWSSGKITSGESVRVPYQGPDLSSCTAYTWQVRVWDNHDRVSKWSKVSTWRMGFLDPETEFRASWITPVREEDTINRPSPYFRKEFSLASKSRVKRATAYITSHGMYEAHLNGHRIGDAYLTPGWTSYNNRLQYQVFDLTASLSRENAIGVVLGNGWYRDYLAWSESRDHYGKDIALLLQLSIEFEDGTEQLITSDGSWKYSTGAILNSEIYDGETYDSTREFEGWTLVGYNDREWLQAQVADFSKNILIATENEVVRKHETFSPKEVITTPRGETVVDFGQNLVGWVQLRTTGRAGDTIVLRHAEVLDKMGNFYTDNLREAEQKVTYVLNGKPKQVLEPHFTFQGFRYVKIEGLSPDAIAGSLEAITLYSDMEPTGKFKTSSALLNQLQHNIQWGQKGNFLDVPTDCPQRDERLGWTGDAQAFFSTAAYNMNVNSLFSKWLKDLAADQSDNGSVPFVIPNVLGPNAGGSAGWADASTIIPWESYVLYGDIQLLENQYESMKSWVGYMRSQSDNFLWNKGFHFGDWLFYRPDDDNDGRAAITDKYLIAQCFFAHSTQLLLKAAEVLGRKDDIAEYTRLLDNVKKAFQREYLTPSGRLVSGSQTAYVLALEFGMLPVELRVQAAERLVANIRSYDNHLTTGFLGTPYLNHVLSENGYPDVAYQLLFQETYPSWLYPVTKGATTIWERWDGIKPDGNFQVPSMNSYNHYAYGAIGNWMYRNIGGIQALEDGPGYKHFRIAVALDARLNSASASLKTYYGTIESKWEVHDQSFEHQVTVPANTSAEVVFPAGTAVTIREGGKALNGVTGISDISTGGDRIRITLASGTYHFSCALD